MVKKIACVFISGTGTNLNNFIKKSREYNFSDQNKTSYK